MLQFAIIIVPSLDFVFDTVWLSVQDWIFYSATLFRSLRVCGNVEVHRSKGIKEILALTRYAN